MIQEKSNYCLCSVLSDIFLTYGIKKSQEEIAKSLTPGKYGFRADDEKIKNLMKILGFNYDFYWWNETPFNEPDLLLDDICHNEGFIGIGNHIWRVLEFQDPTIVVLDPATEYPRDFSYSHLMNQLKEADGGFGLIRKLK